MRNNTRMSDGWRPAYLPEQIWAPRGLPGWMRAFPGWAARAATEGRFPLEVAEWEASLLKGPGAASRGLPDGAGRPVLTIPGFGFGDYTTVPLQLVLKAGGYTVKYSRIISNVRCSDTAVKKLGRIAAEIVKRDNGRRLLVVGHSRGGLLARGLGALFPHLIERVIALGAPMNDEFAFYELPRPAAFFLSRLYQLEPKRRELGCATSQCQCAYMQAIRRPMPAEVELVSIYTTSDGVVDWRSCMVPGATNVEVSGTHLGMGLKPATLRVIMEQLAKDPVANEESPDQ